MSDDDITRRQHMPVLPIEKMPARRTPWRPALPTLWFFGAVVLLALLAALAKLRAM